MIPSLAERLAHAALRDEPAELDAVELTGRMDALRTWSDAAPDAHAMELARVLSARDGRRGHIERVFATSELIRLAAAHGEALSGAVGAALLDLFDRGSGSPALIRVLAAIGVDAEAEPRLRAWARTTSLDMVYSAGPRTMQALLPLIDDVSWEVRYKLVTTVGRRGAGDPDFLARVRVPWLGWTSHADARDVASWAVRDALTILPVADVNELATRIVVRAQTSAEIAAALEVMSTATFEGLSSALQSDLVAVWLAAARGDTPSEAPRLGETADTAANNRLFYRRTSATAVWRKAPAQWEALRVELPAEIVAAVERPPASARESEPPRRVASEVLFARRVLEHLTGEGAIEVKGAVTGIALTLAPSLQHRVNVIDDIIILWRWLWSSPAVVEIYLAPHELLDALVRCCS